MGELGSGKTCFVQGIAEGLGVSEHTRSPTFIFVSEYQGRLRLYHVDLYRIETPLELADLGLDEYMAGRGVCAVEWADKALASFPPEHLGVAFTYMDETTRRIHLEAHGSRYIRLLEGVEQELGTASRHTPKEAPSTSPDFSRDSARGRSSGQARGTLH
jgi:tRNA threonylcarbamoyladenosine biosynthesis protein TsaE